MRLQDHWYRNSLLSRLLSPLGLLFCAAVAVRRSAYRIGLLASHRLPVPVIIVGNISVGGTGKTPLVCWLVRRLRAEGWKPGIIARGYGGRAGSWPQQVRADSDPAGVGDEAVLIARKTGCPMSVGPDRVAAARALLEHSDVDAIVSDDGLQHYALRRDIEIVVIDGVRRFGNGRCLPAGPLRETPGRLREADYVICNGLSGRLEYPMTARLRTVHALTGASPVGNLDAWRGREVHAVAGIGQPDNFFAALRKAGLSVQEHPFPDHHAFQPADVNFGDDLPVLMTEKDAVKCERFAGSQMAWVALEVEPDPRFFAQLLPHLERVRSEAGEVAGVC